jgi:hypothetical protein
MLTPGSAESGWGGGPQGRGAPRGAHRTPFKRGPRARRWRRGARGPHLEKEPVAELHDVGLVDGRDLAPVVQERKPERVLHRAPRLLRRDHLRRRGGPCGLAQGRRRAGGGRARKRPTRCSSDCSLFSSRPCTCLLGHGGARKETSGAEHISAHEGRTHTAVQRMSQHVSVYPAHVSAQAHSGRSTETRLLDLLYPTLCQASG